jgi:hypothetical protein
VPVGHGDSNDFPIPHEQRDRNLVDRRWPQAATDESLGKARWRIVDGLGGIPIRHLDIRDEPPARERGRHGPKTGEDPSGGGERGGTREQEQEEPLIWEALLRFPNAPIYGTHVARKPAHVFTADETWPNLHTVRALGVGDKPKGQIKHVYLLHNGLNETRDMLFHYRLAKWILNKRPDAVCIIRPLPGHLTRYPFDGIFAETPLDTYLRDPMDLFRQFLRYMVETQWLLAIIAPFASYAVVTGGRLRASAADSSFDHASAGDVAEALLTEWNKMFEVSGERRDTSGQDQFSMKPVTQAEMTDMVNDIRTLLDWKAAEPPVGGDGSMATGPEEYPYIHVVGYSVGGFMAQSSFFAWPQVISSCTNLFAGGALRDVAPTAFADPEEWQAVLHGLRYEFDSALESSLLKRRGGAKNARIAGIDASDFDYMKRIFYEVFLQYYRGGYSSRLAEFSRRLFFVLGGDDPIVRIENVLDAGPPEGMTILQLADVSHFPGGSTTKREDKRTIEQEQRVFWLPEIGRVTAQFSERAAETLHNTLVECWDRDDEPPRRNARSGAQAARHRAGVSPNPLDSSAFESTLDRLLRVAGIAGWTLIGRNEIPTVFLGRSGARYHARALHHSEDLLAEYVRYLETREEQLKILMDNTTLLIPQQSEEWLIDRDLRQKLFARSETPGAAYMPSRRELRLMWKHFVDTWAATGAVRTVTAGQYLPEELGPIGEAEAKKLHTQTLPLTMLPDVWIGLSADVCEQISRESKSGNRDESERERTEKAVIEWATRLVKTDPIYESTLTTWLRDEQIVAIKVSAAELNPRCRGGRLWESRLVARALRHWAVAYAASKPLGLD